MEIWKINKIAGKYREIALLCCDNLPLLVMKLNVQTYVHSDDEDKMEIVALKIFEGHSHCVWYD